VYIRNIAETAKRDLLCIKLKIGILREGLSYTG